jgi:hypothetical protein
MFTENFHDYDFSGRHGLVVNINYGHKEGAEKIAQSMKDGGFCENDVEFIFNPKPDIWIYVWPDGVTVDMPNIIGVASRFPQYWRVETLHNYIRNESKQ